MPPPKKHIKEKKSRLIGGSRWSAVTHAVKRAASQLSPRKLLATLSPRKRRKKNEEEVSDHKEYQAHLNT